MTLRDRLKHATQGSHAQAEAAWFGHARFADRAAFLGWLSALNEAHGRLGLPAARCLGDEDLLAAEHSRLAALRQDLGCGPGLGSRKAPTQSFAWGVLYSLNGSAMGASVLLKSNVIAPGWPSAYLRQMRSFATSGGLKRFFRMLDQQVLAEAEAVAGAEAVFRLMSGADALREAS